MTVRRTLRLLATAALVVAVAGVLALLFRAGTSATTPVAALSPVPRPTDSTWPSYSTAAPAPGRSVHPGSPGSPAASPVTPTAGPAPFVQTFAAQPGVRPQPALPSPTSTRSIAINIDGCDHAYGTRTQCIPWTFPAGVTDKCAWLASHGYVRVPVNGVDRQKLDPDGNGTACDA